MEPKCYLMWLLEKLWPWVNIQYAHPPHPPHLELCWISGTSNEPILRMTPCHLELSLATFLAALEKVEDAQGSIWCTLYLEASVGDDLQNQKMRQIRMLQVVRIIICQQFCPRDMLKRQTEGPFRSFWGPTTKKWLAKVNPVRIEDVCLTKYKCKHQEMVRKDLL